MLRCKLDNCPIVKDGRCLEGRGADCPNLIVDSEPSVADSKLDGHFEESQDSVRPVFESLPGIAPLEVAEARAFARRGPCTVVVLAGMRESGKTSLIARLHQLFQAGPVGGLDFAGSRSLPFFEERNWLASVQSGVTEPTMERTSSQFDNSFIHLTVREADHGARIEVFLNDISGETFKTAVAAQSTCESLIGLARADHLVVLVDGHALAQPTMRHYHIEQVRDFLQRVLQNGQCGKRTALHIVISKLDELVGHAAVADKIEAVFATLLRPAVASLNFWRIAARPTDGSYPTSETIAELFVFWTRVTHRYPRPALAVKPREAWGRDFCRYGIGA